PSRIVRRAPRRAPLHVQLFAGVWRERRRGHVEGDSVRDDVSGPDRLPGRVAHERAILVDAVVMPRGHERFGLEPVVERVAATQLYLVLDRVIDCASARTEHRATPSL